MKIFNKSELFLVITIGLLSLNAHAINYEIIGPCFEAPVNAGSFEVTDLKISVGKTSVDILDREQIPYVGSEAGFSSILATPVGEASIEILSDTKMRAYGWCFSVNGISPDLMGSDYFFTSNDDKLVWFYAYSTYDQGKWLDYCVPSFTIKAGQFCAK
jgi:hypothetical protein